MKAFAIGPLVLPYTWFTGMAALALGLYVGQLLARRAGVRDVGPHLFHVFLAGLVAARLAFVGRFFPTYMQSPWDVFDVRDGGWEPIAGALVALAVALWLDRGAAWARKAVSAGVAAAVCAGAAGAAGVAALPSARGETLPNIRLPALDGGTVSLSGFRGKPVVLNLWATWCPPCVHEMPALVHAQESRPDLQFVFVAQEGSAARVRAFFAAEHLAPHAVLLDADGSVAALFHSRALPTTLFFDAQGRLAAARLGELSAATLAQRLARISGRAR